MATLKPPPLRDNDFNSPIWKKWFSDLYNRLGGSLDSPSADNFASLDAIGNIQDSGYDNTSFVKVDGSQDIVMTAPEEWRVGDAANYTAFEADGQITLAGTARVWKARILKPSSVKLPALNPPAEDLIDNFPFHRYDRGTEESVFYIFVLPGDFAVGDASVRGHYGLLVRNPPAGGGADEVVAMEFEYKKLTEGDVFDFGAGTTSGTLYETIVAGETADIIHKTGDGYCVTTGWLPRDVILFRFYRDATNPLDTYDNEGVAANNDAWVFYYYLEYLSSGIGKAS